MREMKESNIPWIGKIPNDWTLLRNKNVYSNSKSIVGLDCENTPLLSLTTNGIKFKELDSAFGKQPENFEGYQKVAVDDVVMCLFDLDCSAVFSGISKLKGMISPAYKILKCNNKIYPLFADYWFKCVGADRNFMWESKNLRYTLSIEEFRNLYQVLPDYSMQIKISSYLDEKCKQIDSLIKLEEKVIVHIKEYKKSIIQKAVTKGINHNNFIDSNIEWIKLIPQTWKTLPTKQIMRKVKEIVIEYSGEDIISLTMNGVVKRDLDNPKGKMPTTFDGYQKVYKGNLLLCLFDIDVTPRCVGLINDNGLTSPAYSQFKMINDNYSPFYNYYLTFIDNDKIYLHLSKNLRSTITEDDFGRIPMVKPPFEEQKDIAKYLDEKCESIEKLIKVKQKKILELKEYKKSLIYEVVTGKKEVD